MDSTIGAARRRSQPGLIAILAVLAAVVVWFAGRKLHYFTDFSPASYSDYFWPRRWGLVLHLTGGATAILTGLVQLWLGLTGRTGAPHRALGRIYVAGVVLGSVGATYMAMTIPGHLAYKSGLLGMNLAWIATTGMAVAAIVGGRTLLHRDWMLRSYAVTFAFVIYRLGSRWLSGWLVVPDDPVATDLDAMLAWGSWALPLLLVEIGIGIRAMRSGKVGQ